MTESSAKSLYDAAFERDSCGFGLIANLDDESSHWVVQTAIGALTRLTHRGAIAADGKTGDGCGLLIKQPHDDMGAAEMDRRTLHEDLSVGGIVSQSRIDEVA